MCIRKCKHGSCPYHFHIFSTPIIKIKTRGKVFIMNILKIVLPHFINQAFDLHICLLISIYSLILLNQYAAAPVDRISKGYDDD